MRTNLVIVESKGKVATITKYLNANPALKHMGKFVVSACFGHIDELKKPGLGVDVDNNFKPTYELIPEKEKLVMELIKKAQIADAVYLATDEDNEGEKISQSLRDRLHLKKYKRIVFTEITQRALEHAIKNPRLIDENQVAAQETRRILDRLVGFKLSPLLWKKFTSKVMGLSAGRVQSALMHLIIEREKEISAFQTTPYWHLNGDFALDIDSAKNKLEAVRMYKGDTIYKTEDPKHVQDFFKVIKNQWKVDDVKSRVSRQKPDNPFITSTLQQEASSKLRMSIKRTMQVAQELYEGGFITYMRTDSFNMSEDFKASAKTYIDNAFGPDYYEGGNTKAKTVKGAQEAHECIRVTNVELSELSGDKWDKNHKELYKMIWQRSVAYLMKPAIYDELEVKIRDAGMPKDMLFITTFKRVKFNGYLVVYGVKIEDTDLNRLLNSLKEGKYKLTCLEMRAKNTWTSPPSRYNEAALVKLMEQSGIGRPSSYSSILEKLFTKTYVIKTDIKGEEHKTTDYVYKPVNKSVQPQNGSVTVGAEQSKVLPTDVGIKIDDYLSQNFEYIIDKNFTAYMENDLDEIAEGTKKKTAVLNTFWKNFSVDIAKQESSNKTGPKEKKVVLETKNTAIPVDGKDYTVRLAKYGPVIQYDGNKYINLKPYLMLTKKQYTEVTEDDIRFLTQIPRDIAKVNGKPVTLAYGQYGLYLKYDGKNVSIFKKLALALIKGQEVDVADLKSAIDYNASKGTTPPKEKVGVEPKKKLIKKKDT